MERGCDYVFLLNHDAKPGVDAIKESVRVAEAHKDAGAVQPMLLLWQKPDRLNSSGNDVHFLGFGLTRDFGKYRTDVKRTEGEEIGYASGAGVLYRVAALKEVGLLEEYFWMYHEDLELGWRLRLAGWKSVLAPTAFVYHDYEFHRSTKKMYWMERNRLLTHLSHLSPRSFLLLAPALLLIEKVVFVGACMNGWGREKWRSWGWVFDRSAWQYIARAHADVRRLRRVDDREACAIFVGRIEHQGVDHVLVRRLLNPLLAAYWGVVKRLL
jgi:GT2 family glycosyltransferase